MKSRLAYIAAVVLCLTMASAAWGQWSSDPMKNLALADKSGDDQVQPKVRPLPGNGWYVSWFDGDGAGYDVYYQRLNPSGVERLTHDGVQVADLSNSSTEDYGLDFDKAGNALLAFLDSRENSNFQQITAAKMSPNGKPLWGKRGVQLTKGSASNAAPKIAGTSDGNIVVAWTSNSNVVLQRLDSKGHAMWGKGVVFSESGFNYTLADLHATDNGSVIVSWVRDSGFSSNHQLRANKLSSKGKLLWGKSNVVIFDQGSLQLGEFPYFVLDGKGGAVFSWYTSFPALQCFAQHILANGKEAFPHNGSEASTNASNVRVGPAVSYLEKTDETFLFWTEEDGNQVMNGIYAQKFDGKGGRKWGDTGLVVVPLGSDQLFFAQNVQIGSGALAFWVDMVGFGSSTIQAAKLDGTGKTVCAQFPVSSIPSNKTRLAADITSAGLAAVAFEDDRIGNNGIYIQNVNPDCSLGQK